MDLSNRVNMRKFSIAILLFLLCFVGTLLAQEPKPRKFPVKLKVTAKKPDDMRRQEVSIQLIIEKDVHIYAHRVKLEKFQPLPTKVTITTSNGKEIDAKYTYPKGIKMENEIIGEYSIYKGKITIRAIITRNDNDGPLKIKCRVMGYHNTSHY